MTAPLADGEYPAFVVDLEPGLDDSGSDVMHLELTILSGEHKGDLVSISSSTVTGDYVDLIGMPATLTVSGGQPDVTIDR
jgi:hypothetical protein